MNAKHISQVYVYYEQPPVCDRYFKQAIKKVATAFKIKRVTYKQIDRIENLKIEDYSPYPRIILTNQPIEVTHTTSTLEGIGLEKQNLAIISYLPLFKNMPFLITHELGHLLGLVHCTNSRCLMGIVDSLYSWKQIASIKQTISDPFCSNCQNSVYG